MLPVEREFVHIRKVCEMIVLVLEEYGGAGGLSEFGGQGNKFADLRGGKARVQRGGDGGIIA